MTKFGTKRETSSEEFLNAEKLLAPTPENAYLLGFIWGDGCLNPHGYSVRVEIKREDYNCIQQIFSTDLGWKVSYRERPGRQPQAAPYLSNKRYREYLNEHGFKTKTINDPDLVLASLSKELHRHWWHGYFDSDGCIYVNPKWSTFQIAFTGHVDLTWKSGIELLDSLEIKPQIRVIHNKNSYSQLRFTKRSDVEKFLNWIHKDVDFGLQRKHKSW